MQIVGTKEREREREMRNEERERKILKRGNIKQRKTKWEEQKKGTKKKIRKK